MRFSSRGCQKVSRSVSVIVQVSFTNTNFSWWAMLRPRVSMSCLLLSKQQSRGSSLSPAPERASPDAGLWRGCWRWGWGDSSCVHPCAEMSWDNQFFPRVTEASSLRREAGLGGETWWMSSLHLSLSVGLSRDFELFPHQKWDEVLWTAHLSCRHMYVPGGCCVTHSAGVKEFLGALSVSSAASGDVGFTAHTIWLLKHIHTLRLSVISMHLKATEWWVTMCSTRNGHIFHPFASALCTYLSDFPWRPINKLEST